MKQLEKDRQFIAEVFSVGRQMRRLETAIKTARPNQVISDAEAKEICSLIDRMPEIYRAEREILAMVSSDRVSKSAAGVAQAMPIFKINSDGLIKASIGGDGLRRFSLIASSDATDLSGDVFTEKSLQRMKDTAKGMTMFLNHSYNVPDDVFGVVEEATLTKRKVWNSIDSKNAEYLCLTYDGIVTEVNPAAVRTHEMMLEGVVRLAASVSVLIVDKYVAKDGRRMIDDVVNLECSVVGLGCNPTSWVESASKALKAA
ncbi:MAG: hypothetical protein HY231_13885 [Acidobacteria bacterium]|nr:hypothetical protein [Acidobacteriota bacterium]